MMKLAELPKEVIANCHDVWRLDIDSGFDSKHDWMAWWHFIALPENPSSHYETTEDSLLCFCVCPDEKKPKPGSNTQT